MWSYTITTTDVDLLRQSTRELYSKIELLNSNFKIVDHLEGTLINDDVSINANSDVRRTYNCSLFVTDSTFEIAKDSKIWIDRMIRPYVGMKNLKNGEIVWYLMGTYKISSTSVTYNATTHTLNLTCNDLMCSLENEYGGIVGHAYKYKIEAGENVRTVILGLLRDAHITNYHVGLILEEIPYDLEFDHEASYYDMLKKVLDLFAEGWQMYFDIYGTFIWEPIPISMDDEIRIDNTTMQSLLIQENRSDNFSGIYNKTIVYGKVLEPEYYGDDVTLSDNVYHAKVDKYNVGSDTMIDSSSYIEYRNFDMIGLKINAPNTGKPTYININGIGKVPICDDDGDYLEPNQFKANEVWVFRYRQKNDRGFSDFYCLGQYMPYGEYTEDSEDVLYSTKNVGKELLQVIELDSIYSDDLARQRAVYETYLKCRRLDTINLNMMAVYWLDVNQKVEYQPIGSEKPYQYLINSISYNSTDGTMSVSLQRFYDDYTVFYKKMNGTYKR